jgi:hypothetical protein
MSFLSRIAALFSGAPKTNNRYFSVYVVSNRCREPVAGQVDLLNELSLTDEKERPYFVRKVLHTSGRNRCFDQVEVQLWFDSNKRLMEKDIFGGRWLERDEYDALLQPEAEEAGDETSPTEGQASLD